MTAERRLAAVEAALTPTELVVAWLEEAHGYGSLEAAVRSTLAEANPVPPLDKLARAAADGARTQAKGQRADKRSKAIDTAVSETVARFRLVLRIITVACDLLDRQLLLEGLFGARLGLLLTTDQHSAKRDPRYLPSLVELRDMIVGRVDELLAAAEARATVERRYLGGHPALFPDRQAEWTERIGSSLRFGALAVGLTDKEHVAPPTPPTTEVTTARIAQRLRRRWRLDHRTRDRRPRSGHSALAGARPGRQAQHRRIQRRSVVEARDYGPTSRLRCHRHWHWPHDHEPTTRSFPAPTGQRHR